MLKLDNLCLVLLTSRYSITVTKLIGSNPIGVLATLLLVSYTKVFIEVYSSVDLDYPDNKTMTVWLKDANVPYLQASCSHSGDHTSPCLPLPSLQPDVQCDHNRSGVLCGACAVNYTA